MSLSFLRLTKTNLHQTYNHFGRRNFVKAIFTDDNVLSCTKKVEIPPANVNLYSFITEKFETYGENTALIEDASGYSITYNRLLKHLQSFGSALSKIGFVKGDTIAVLSQSCPEYVYPICAAAALGGLTTTLNPAGKLNEVLYQLKSSGASVLFSSPKSAPIAKECARNLGIDKIIVNDLRSDIDSDGVIKLSDLLDDDGKYFPQGKIVSYAKDITLLPYSSGTTGLPKGVMLSHHAIATNIIQADACMPDRNIQLGNMPCFHIAGITLNLLNSLRFGKQLILQEGFQPEQFLTAIQRYKVDHINLVPPLVLFMLNHPLVKQFDVSSLRFCIVGAAPCGRELYQRFSKKFPHVSHFHQGWGMTETSPVATFQIEGNIKHGSVGLPAPNTEIKVVCIDNGKSLEANKSGELCIRGPQTMEGYMNNEAATKSTIKDDGWLHTGDIGYYDDDGHVFVIDRLKELIKYKGYQVPPAELEDLLLGHPLIVDAVVIGIPDERAGELPKAFVVKKTETNLTEKDVIEYVKEHVSSHKQLRGGVKFIDIIPKSASGKILRREIKQAIQSSLDDG